MKIGIFGGTFDPFTLAHEEIVEEALKHVDKILVVPTTISYYRDGKSQLFSFNQRCLIIRAFIRKNKWEKKVDISRLEEDRDSFWRTADTIAVLKKDYPNDELCFILGSDSFDTIDTWRDSDYLKENVKFIVVDSREGIKTTNNFPHETITITRENISATKVREKLIRQLIGVYLNQI